MKKIFKYKLAHADFQVIEMPQDAEIITVAVQAFSICIWAIVDTEKEAKSRLIEIVGTGNPMDERVNARKFIGTAFNDGLVWHVFEVTSYKTSLITDIVY